MNGVKWIITIFRTCFNSSKSFTDIEARTLWKQWALLNIKFHCEVSILENHSIKKFNVCNLHLWDWRLHIPLGSRKKDGSMQESSYAWAQSGLKALSSSIRWCLKNNFVSPKREVVHLSVILTSPKIVKSSSKGLLCAFNR